MEQKPPFSPHSLHASRNPQSSQQPETHQKLETNSYSKPPTQLHQACLEEGPPEWFLCLLEKCRGFPVPSLGAGKPEKGAVSRGHKWSLWPSSRVFGVGKVDRGHSGIFGALPSC